MKRFISLMLIAVMMLSLLVVGSNAADRPTGVSERNMMVWELLQIIQDPDNTVPFNPSNGMGILDGIIKRGTVIKGSDAYEESYYNRIITDSITLDADSDAYLEKYELGYISRTIEANRDKLGIIGPFGEVIDAGITLRKMADAQLEYLDALQLVVNYTDDCSMKDAAQDICDVLSTDALDKYYSDAIRDNLIENVGFDLAIEVLSEAADKILFGADILFGRISDNAMYEFFLAQYQAKIKLAFYNAMGDGNYLLKDYSDEELWALQCLAALYLHTGALDPVTNDVAESCRSDLVTVQTMTVPAESGLKIEDYSYPGQYTGGNLNVGTKYVIFGTVHSDSIITNVSVEVTNTQTQEKAINVSSGPVGSTEYNLIELDSNISIETLAGGSYIIQYTVETESEGKRILVSQQFTITPSTYTISDYRLPSSIPVGGVFNVTGVISGSALINSVVVEIVSLDGTRVYTHASEAPNSYRYDLKELDPYVLFQNVPEGYGRYRILCNETVLIDQPYISTK